jgi:ferric-dicitrate binding protein FerR (iron transport regulator)
MEKKFNSVEEILADEAFLSWYFRDSNQKATEWDNWLAANPQQQPLINEAITTMEQLDVKPNPVSTNQIESAYNRLSSQLHQFNKSETSAPAPVISMYRKNSWWKVAAAVVVIIAAGLVFWKFSGTNQTQLAANYGQTIKHQLPDGTEVMLNANSKVTLGKNWEAGKDREVWLNGEAFFHVTKTSAHDRFIVHADMMDVIVTGTQFNVITRNHHSSVLLTEGSVTIRSKNGKEILMRPGDFVELNNNDLQKKLVNEDGILAWKDNKLFFGEETPMPDAANMISEHYGIKVTLADQQVRERPLSGIMQNDNLDVLVKSLEESGLKITRKENEIIISIP